jgi:hypothetical protein
MMSNLLTFKRTQPLPHVVHLSNTRVNHLQEVEEFLVAFNGFSLLGHYFSEVIIYSPALNTYQANSWIL